LGGEGERPTTSSRNTHLISRITLEGNICILLSCLYVYEICFSYFLLLGVADRTASNLLDFGKVPVPQAPIPITFDISPPTIVWDGSM
jgi:hypothetical protein